MKISRHLLPLAVMLAALLPVGTGLADSGPPVPPQLFYDWFSFQETNFDSDLGIAPLNYSNAISVSDCWGNAVMLDTSNLEPAFLQYNIIESNGFVNLDLGAGAVFLCVTPDWASADTNQCGIGPGDVGYLLAAGDFSSGSPQGLWAIYVDAGGTNLYFGGVSNSQTVIWASAPISWASNSYHEIAVTYSTSTNSMLYLDGQFAASGGPVTIVPASTNAFYVGSDNMGYSQFRGEFLWLECDTTNLETYFGANYFTDWWDADTNSYSTWLNPPGDGQTGMMSPGILNPRPSSPADITGDAVYLTNMSVAVVPGQGVAFTFAIEGGSNGVPYDVFSTTNLGGPSPANAVWTWLGQGTNSGIYQVTNQPIGSTYFLLGTPLLASDGSGLTVAWERLIGVSGTPNAWYLGEGLSLQTGIANADPNRNGLANCQEYLYGGNPLAAVNFAVWVAQPGGTSGIP